MNNGNSKYSVISLFREYNEIKIPIIQRDYAQGRESTKEIRKNFLNSIKDNLNKKLHLDFIYGSVKNKNGRKVLTLLDGQQRITTLFLLYWYAAVKEKNIEKFREIFCFKIGRNHKSKLRYEVRASSEEFLDYIVSQNIKFEDNKNPSEVIKDKNWFYLGWIHDPTISGMLNMIDSIEEIFRDEAEIFKLLYNDVPPKITFDFLELNNFGLTDDLYIKMNSRGKLLTPYENFKAKFEKLIERYLKEKFIEIAKKFEKDYMDIFWKYAKRNKKNQKQDIARSTDGYMYRFFYNLTLNLYAINNETDLRNNYSKIDDFIQENSLISFLEKVYESKEEEIANLIEFLEYLCNNNQNIPEQVKDILRENPTLWDRVRFYAYYLGIIEHKDDEHWYRVLKNLINNTLIQSLDEYIKALKAIKNLSDDLNKNTKKILDHIETEGENFISFFNQKQRAEEVLKAKLINKNSSWKSEIINAENHWYLDGKIKFLIEFSENEDAYDLEKFKNYIDKFIKLWDFAKGNKDNQILLYQVLLSKGDYLPEVGWNKSFCSFDTGIRAKSESWHGVFESEKKEFLKKLLDDFNFTSNTETELKNIIRKEVTKIKDWRKYFIENPDYIKYCEKLQLRFYFSDNREINKIYLLKRKQLNGHHVELNSWHLFNKCFGLKHENDGEVECNKACDPFNCTEYVESKSYEEPYILLSGFKYKLESEEYDLQLRIIYENGKFLSNFIDMNGKDISGLDLRINKHKIEKEATFDMPQENENCCKFIIKLKSLKINGQDI